MSSPRSIHLWDPVIRQRTRTDGSILVWQEGALGPYPARLSDRIAHWAEAAPDRTWMAERDGEGWRQVDYATLWDLMGRVGGALLALGLSPDRPLLILSGNGLDHAIAASHEYFEREQHEAGYWHRPLEANATMDAQYIYFMHFMGRVDAERQERVAKHLLATQASDGNWSLYAGARVSYERIEPTAVRADMTIEVG